MRATILLAAVSICTLEFGGLAYWNGPTARSNDEQEPPGRVVHLDAPKQVKKETPTSKAVRFRLDFPAESETSYRILTERIIVQKGKEAQPFKTTAGYTLRFKHLRDKSEYIDLVVTIDRLEWAVTGTPSDKSLDTQSSQSDESNKDLAFLRSLVGTTYDMVLDEKGNLYALRSTDPIRKSVPPATITPPENKGSQGISKDGKGTGAAKSRFKTPDPAPVEKQDATQWREMVGENQLRNLFKIMYSWVPASPIEVSSRWQREDRSPAGTMMITRRNLLKLHSIEGDEATILSRIDLSSSARPDANTEATAPTTLHQEVPGAAMIVFDRKTGLIKNLRAEVEFELHAPAAKNLFGKASEVVQTLTAKTTVELVSTAKTPSPSAAGDANPKK